MDYYTLADAEAILKNSTLADSERETWRSALKNSEPHLVHFFVALFRQNISDLKTMTQFLMAKQRAGNDPEAMWRIIADEEKFLKGLIGK